MPELNDWTVHYPGLMPWEPLITGARDYLHQNCVADEEDTCDECGCSIPAGELIVNGCGHIFCNWECAVKHAEDNPGWFYIHHT